MDSIVYSIPTIPIFRVSHQCIRFIRGVTNEYYSNVEEHSNGGVSSVKGDIHCRCTWSFLRVVGCGRMKVLYLACTCNYTSLYFRLRFKEIINHRYNIGIGQNTRLILRRQLQRLNLLQEAPADIPFAIAAPGAQRMDISLDLV